MNDEIVDVPSGVAATRPTPLPGDPVLRRLSLNQRTTANWTAEEAIEGAARVGLRSVGLWRDPIAETGLDTVRHLLVEHDMRVSSICRGGFFTARDSAAFARALAYNRAAIDEVEALEAGCLVLVPGGLPDGDRDITAARRRVVDAIGELAPYAAERGVVLAIEPMHPLFAADRGVVSTLAQALDMAEGFDPSVVGVVVDTFHLWWEPDIISQIARASGRVASYQICDWITPFPSDALLSRGMMGDGHIDFAAITAAIAATGYPGDVEVEIFNADVWAAPGDHVIATMARRYAELVAPYLEDQ